MTVRLNGTDSANGQIAHTPRYDAQPVIREGQAKSGLSLNFTIDHDARRLASADFFWEILRVNTPESKP